MSRQSSFSIIQLSDLHLTRFDSASRSEVKLFGHLKGMNETFRALVKRDEVKGADLMLVTGDITDRGEIEAWKIFKSVLDRENWTKRCLVIPGNHDVCNLGVSRSAWSRERIDRDLEKARAGLRIMGQRTKFPWALEVSNDVVIFGIDSCNPGNLSVVTNAVGQIGWRQLEAFARLLLKHKNSKIKIVVLHHSPNIPGKEKEEERGFKPTGSIQRWGSEIPSQDRQALRLLCVSHGVRAILHGHLHRDEVRRVNGVRIIGVPASTELKTDGKRKYVELRRYTINENRSHLRSKLITVPVS